jgi:4-amino-4-deoxy-L-arabinose transferase-like glycosyltransferase
MEQMIGRVMGVIRRLAPLMLLALYVGLALTAVLSKGPAYDEPAHMVGGYSYWTENDYRLLPESGNWSQRWIALPLVLSNQAEAVPRGPAWRTSDVWALGDWLIAGNPSGFDRLLVLSRMMVLLAGLVLGLTVFVLTRRVAGPTAGLVGLTLFVFSPTMLSHGGLATADLMSALTLLVATWAFWRALHDGSTFSLLRSCLLMAIAVLTKFSGILLAPIAVSLVVLRLTPGRSLTTGHALTAGRLGLIAATHVMVGLLFVWGSFGFRHASNHTTGDFDRHRVEWASLEGASPTLDSGLSWARRTGILPEAFIYGLAHSLRNTADRPSFFRGDVSTRGSAWFFPYAFAAKSTVPVLLISMAALVIIGCRVVGGNGNAIYNYLPFVVLIVVCFGAAVSSGLNIGHRHLLPIYPPLFIVAGGLVGGLAASCWQSARTRTAMGIVLVILLAWHAGAAIRAAPHFLAYFNEPAGGPARGYKNLVDSSLDWGQDLPFLTSWLGENNPAGEPVHLAYFGVDHPGRYLPSVEVLPSRIPLAISQFGAGLYVVSATVLQSVHLPTPGEWRAEYDEHLRGLEHNVKLFEAAKSDSLQRERLEAAVPPDFWPRTFQEFNLVRLAKLTASLRNREPLANIAGTMLVYRLTRADVDTLRLNLSAVDPNREP